MTDAKKLPKVEMKIEMVAVGELRPAEYNPRYWSKDARRDLKQSIIENGFVQPIVVNRAESRKNIVIGGNFKLDIAKELGLEKVPVHYVNYPDIKIEKKLNLRLNKNQGEFDFKLLREFDEYLLQEVGFDEDGLDRIFNEGAKDEKFDVQKEIEAIKTPKSKVGEVYQLGRHRLMCGDATNEDHAKELMGGGLAKLIFTSPPYNMAGDMYKGYADNLKSDEYIKFNLDVIDLFSKYLRGFIFWNISYNKNARWEFIEILYKIVKETRFKFLELIVWNKKAAMPITSKEMLTRTYEDVLLVGDEDMIVEDLELWYCGRNDRKAYFNKKTQKALSNYWELPVNNVQLKNHLACFPVSLPMKGIVLMTERKDIVLDPFMGSGTTLIAAEQTGRISYGMELNPTYVDVCIKRWEEFTGEKATRIDKKSSENRKKGGKE